MNFIQVKENEIPTSALLSNTPHLYQTGRFDIECYPGEDQKNGIRRTATNIILLLNKKNPDNSELSNELSSWHEYDFKESREKHYDSFLSNSQVMPHGRIEGDAYFLVEELIDLEGKVIVNSTSVTASGSMSPGCLGFLSGITQAIYGFNLRLKNWLNSLFGKAFGSSLIGQEPNGCMPSMLPSGCSGPGCSRFGCGFLSLLLGLLLLLWLLKNLLYGDYKTSSSNKERIIHDTIYVNKEKQDTLTYIDETTNTTVKMLSLPNVQFEKNKTKLLSSSLSDLNSLADYLLQNKEINAEIIGHTDSDGDATANKELSQSRAEEVKRYIVSLGVQESRIKATGKGESEPRTENETAEGRAMNRRVEVKLTQYNSTKTTRTKK
jgi:outer membrane protein OmpA-like peptidoglycan-associated protein